MLYEIMMRGGAKSSTIIKKGGCEMNGVQFIVDSQGQKTAALIDFKKYGALWEDLYDNWLAQKRKNEPRETLQTVRERLKRQGKLNG
jgi:hypothetical protein